MCLESHKSNGQVNENVLPESREHEVACTDDVLELGYNGLYDYLGEFGPLPIGDEIYYETPFSGKQNDSHSHEDRIYEVCHEGSGGEYREPDYTNCFGVPDMSYLVEPVEGVWLLALDTNVYIPRKDADQIQINNGKNFNGSGNAGYNKVITHKKHLIPWMTDVARRAKKKEKKLISFSHFPAADFYNGAGPLIEEVWGEDEFQMVRMPKPATTHSIAATGIGLHIAGHMHMNGMEIATDESSGKVLTNIQVPSLAAYVPAYKIVRMFKDSNTVEVETVILDKVTDFDTLFSLYEQEWHYLNRIGYERIWNKSILDSETYLDFTDWHIRELSRLRFLPGEWPDNLREVLKTTDGRQLLIAADLPAEVWHQHSWEEILMNIEQTNMDIISTETETDLNIFDYATKRVKIHVQNNGLNLLDFESWDGNMLSIDFYRIRNAGELALKHIPEERIIQYSIIASVLREKASIYNQENENIDELHRSIHAVFEVMALFSNRLPSEHSLINLETGKVTPVVERR